MTDLMDKVATSTTENTADILADRLRKCLLKKSINANQLAKAAQLKPTFVYDILNGKSRNPSAISLLRIADVLETTLHYLLGNENTQTHPDWTNFIFLPRFTTDFEDAESSFKLYAVPRPWLSQITSSEPTFLRIHTFDASTSRSTSTHDKDTLLLDLAENYFVDKGYYAVSCNNAAAFEYFEHPSQMASKSVIARVIWHSPNCLPQ